MNTCLTATIAPEGAASADLHDTSQPVALHPLEEAMIVGSHPSRKREFALGRACARAALAELGIGGTPLPRAQDGAAVWPAGFCGAITHTRGYAAALAAPVQLFRGLGVDAERVGAVTPDLFSRLFSLSEIAALESLAPEQREIAATVLFSAKESAFKAISAATGRRPHLAQLEISLGAGEFLVRMAADISLTGRFIVQADLAVTGLGMP